MIELTFSDSAAGALKWAKKLEGGKSGAGAVGIVGGGKSETDEASFPWTGRRLEGTSAEVISLSLMLDMGKLGGVEEARSTEVREKEIQRLLQIYPGAAEDLSVKNRQSLQRIDAASAAGEKIRVWMSPNHPGEVCGFYFLCQRLLGTSARLYIVRIPSEMQRAGRVIRLRSSGELPPEAFSELADVYEEPVVEANQELFADLWCEQVRENAPLRVILNGNLTGVPADFYDLVLRGHFSGEQMRIGSLIGKVLGNYAGISDYWLYYRLLFLIEAGEFEVVGKTREHPYSRTIRLCR